MDVVRTFNNELSSLYEVKPPISKAKMTQITRSAIKGIKFYKHIVQSVEKFIQKCRPEYKVPGLYVVDSIVRQSRHQFGSDKDVFAPRFAKNITATFLNLFKCVEEDRPKIVRVLNLWQKNSVFASDVIQPLMDMANPNSANESLPQASTPEPVSQNSNSKSKSVELSSWKGWPQNAEEQVEEPHGFSEITAKNLEKFAKANYPSSAALENTQVPQTKNTPVKSAELPAEKNTLKFNEKLLDFDYGDEEDEEEPKADDSQLPDASNTLAFSLAQKFLSNPDIFSQFQQMQQSIQCVALEMAMQPQVMVEKEGKDTFSPNTPDCTMNVGTIPYPEQHHANMPYSYDGVAAPFVAPQPPQIPMIDPKMSMEPVYPMVLDEPMLPSHVDEDDRMIYSMPGEPPLPPQDLDERALGIVPIEEHMRKERSRSRSGSRTRGRSGRHRSRSKSPRRRKSRSRSRSWTRKNRSRERERQREREREREKEHDREKKGIPPVKKNYVTVCSTTLWLGHVPKTYSEVDISEAFSPFGTILSVDMIPPRGCAYVVMDRRQDAHKALQKLKNSKTMGSMIKMAWAPGKGVKGREFKEFWEVSAGASFIPYEKIPQNDLQTLDLLAEGGFVDEKSLPQSLKDLKRQQEQTSTSKADTDTEKSTESVLSQTASGPSGMMSNTTMGMPMVLSQMMQPQFGMPMPGMMPPQSMVVQMPLAVPPPNQLMMVQPPAQTLLAGTPLPVGSIPQMPHLSMPHPSLPPTSVTMSTVMSSLEMSKENALSSAAGNAAAGDATPTDEDGTSVSSPSTTSALDASTASVSVSSFNPAMGHHGMSRPILPVMPPVSSAGTPIPFPPPQVGFGFPPPPLRPGVPNQSLPGGIPLPNSFPWMHKASASGYGNFPDSDMRFPAHMNASSLNVRLPLTNQSMFNNSPSNNQIGTEHQRSQSSSKDNTHKTPSQKDKSSVGDAAKKYSNRLNSNSEMFGRHGTVSPKSYNDDSDMAMESPDESRPSDFSREIEVGLMPRFPGPPDFHMARGLIRAPWMHGPGPRFPRNMHPGSPFPPRGNGHMRPRMDMEYFRHQGPPGPRMHMPGSHPSQPMWGNNGFPPSRNNQDRYQNRRDYYDNPRYSDEDRDRRYHSREDRGRSRIDHRDEADRKNDDDRRHQKSELKCDDRERKDGDNKKDSEQFKSDEKRNSDSKPDLPKPSKSQNVDMSFDMFRLQSYGNRSRRPGMKPNLPHHKKVEQCNTISADKEGQSGKDEIVPNSESKNHHKTDESVPEALNTENNVAPIEQSDGNSESRSSRRDRADRKRSRWGRTLSQEREFQQQRINELEMKFQSYENQHQGSCENLNVNGNTTVEDPFSKTAPVHSEVTEITNTSCPDGGTSFPDGGTSFPDGGTSFPDDGTSFPDGGTSFPDDGTSFPDGGTSFPDDGTSFPDGGTSFPDDGTSFPDGGTSFPDDGTSFPDGGTSFPDDGISFPDGSTSCPSDNAAEATNFESNNNVSSVDHIEPMYEDNDLVECSASSGSNSILPESGDVTQTEATVAS